MRHDWHDATDSNEYFTIYRTHGDGFSVIFGNFTHGNEAGLLEAKINEIPYVTGHLAANDAYELCKEALGWKG